MSEPGFQTVYAGNWSLDWSLYRDIFIFARDNHIPMVALNIPKELVTKVSRQGYASLTSEEKKGLPQGTTCDLNNPHTAFLRKSFWEVFKHVTNGRVFTYFCEAQTLRNSGMANAVARACSVLQFHAISMLSPMLCGGAGGAKSTGRPLSNNADSKVVMRGPCRLFAGLPKMMRSNTRP